MWPIFYYKLVKTCCFWLYQQVELPKPEKSNPGEVWGVYSLRDFMAENWLYLSAIIFFILVFLILQRRRRSRYKN